MTDVPPGWRAIDGALAPLYGSQRPRHYAPVVPLRAGGRDPLHGVSAYFVGKPVPHWHLVSYGLTELFSKESANPKVSGYGFELTLRLGGARPDGEPELWAAGLMQTLARYVYSTNRYFEAGHFFELPEPIVPGFAAVCFVSDPELKVTTGEFGTFEFLQIVPLRDEEVRALKAWNTLGLLGVMAKRDPKWIFTPGRPSVVSDPAAAKAIAEGTAREGSATPRLRLQAASWRPGYELSVGASDAKTLAAVLRGRVPFGRPLEVLTGEEDTPRVVFAPGAPGVRSQGTVLHVSLDKERATLVAQALESGQETVASLPELRLRTKGA